MELLILFTLPCLNPVFTDQLGGWSNGGTHFVQVSEQGKQPVRFCSAMFSLSLSLFFLLFPFLLHAMYKVKHLFCSVMCELMWINQTIIAVLVQSALQPFVSNDNRVYCWNADFVTFQHKAVTHKSSCVAVKLPLPGTEIKPEAVCMYCLLLTSGYILRLVKEMKSNMM